MSDEQDDRTAIRGILDFASENRVTYDEVIDALVNYVGKVRYEVCWSTERRGSPFVHNVSKPTESVGRDDG